MTKSIVYENDGRRLTYEALSDSLFEDPHLAERRWMRKLYARALDKLECFVEDALASKELPFIPKVSGGAGKGYHKSPIAEKHFAPIAQSIAMVNTFSDKYLYSEYVDTFRQACIELGIAGKHFDWRAFDAPGALCSDFNHQPNAEVFNALWLKVKEIYRLNGYAAKRSVRLRDLKDRSDNYIAYMESPFEFTDDIVVVRLDLFYLPTLADSITLDMACDDVSRLFEYRRSNKIFKHLMAHIAKIELGLFGRIHIHVILVFDGSKPGLLNHTTLGRRLGEYWSGTITKNKGDYWNCNAPDEIKKFEKWGVCGIGLINKNDEQRRENFRTRVVGYLLKPDQHAKLKYGETRRTIRRGRPLFKLHPVEKRA